MTDAVLHQDAGARLRTGTIVLAALVLALLLAVMLAVAIGPVPVALADLGRILLAPLGVTQGRVTEPTLRDIVLELRLPRALTAVCVGAVLAIGGVAMQGLFRNPLADPGLIGVSSGAALATTGFIVLGGSIALLPAALRFYTMPFAAFIGGLIVVLLIARLAQRDGRTDIATMLLAGIAVTAVVMAGIGLLTFVSDDAQLRSITFWTLGSLGGAGWAGLMILAPTTLLVLMVSLGHARVLDAMILGEREAYSLGFDLEAAKRLMILTVAAGIGAAVAFTGLIGFVGIVAPHMMRLVLGPSHHRLLIGSGLLGSLILVLADTACRIIVAPAELPIGIVTSLLGAPFFLLLLRGRRGEAS